MIYKSEREEPSCFLKLYLKVKTVARRYLFEEMSTKAIDPVCGMEVSTAEAKYKTEHMGKTFYFCAEGCLREFEKNPQKYMKEGHRHSCC